MKFIISALILSIAIWLSMPKYQLFLVPTDRNPRFNVPLPAVWKLNQQTGELLYCYEFSQFIDSDTKKDIRPLGPRCYPEAPSDKELHRRVLKYESQE